MAYGMTFVQENKLVLINGLTLEPTIPFTVRQISMLFAQKESVKIGAKKKEYASTDNAITHKLVSKLN
jgi:hypothetical protein